MNHSPFDFAMHTPLFYTKEDLSVSELDEICQREVVLSDYPLASRVEKKIVIYDGAKLREKIGSEEGRTAVKRSFTRCLRDGPGVFVIQSAYEDTAVIDSSTDIFRQIVADEKAAGAGQGDHFGHNERIWNATQKACQYAPDLFIDYYGNPFIALACEAWLGPHYQITAQMNNVKPGSAAQSAHRDYHLGFQSRQTIKQFPAHAQIISQYLTLQGAVAHGDMPIEMGPTLLLPFSHHYQPGYLAFREPEFVQYFDDNKVQIPFQKGDMVYFSPALFHGAGKNQTERDRIANLLQVSSAFGRPMETVNRYKMVEKLYPILLERVQGGLMGKQMLRDVITAVADAYSFPTNLDSDPPINGNAPETAFQMIHHALKEEWQWPQLFQALEAYQRRRQA